jgi:hypothetical protein
MRDLALETAAELTKNSPENANLWFQRGVVELLCDRKGDAMDSLSRAARLEESLMEAWALLSTLWAQFDQPQAAQTTARRVLSARPDLAPVIAQVAFELQNNHATLEALDVLDAVAESGYVTIAVARAHAQLLGETGYHQEAVTALRAIWNTSMPQSR